MIWPRQRHGPERPLGAPENGQGPGLGFGLGLNPAPAGIFGVIFGLGNFFRKGLTSVLTLDSRKGVGLGPPEPHSLT